MSNTSETIDNAYAAKVESLLKREKVTIEMTIEDVEVMLNLIADAPYNKVKNVIEFIMQQTMPQAQEARKKIEEILSTTDEEVVSKEPEDV